MDKALPLEIRRPPRRAAIMNKIHLERLMLVVSKYCAREINSRYWLVTL